MKAALYHLVGNDNITPLPKLYSDFATANQPGRDSLLPEFSGCWTQMLRARRENMPPLPTSRDDIDLSRDWSLSSLAKGSYFIRIVI